MLASPVTEGIGFYRSEFQPKKDERPYMQSAIHCILAGNSPLSTISTNFNMKPNVSFMNVMVELEFLCEGINP